ncbi:MAG: molybdopterin-guanine dinucleotide biosynthesis protein A [Alphaproteobacteria bacterium]|nr:molybdopterin-guanine dinucleotide biosynthesis protein A [Alphaproteobacteria bacterium]
MMRRAALAFAVTAAVPVLAVAAGEPAKTDPSRGERSRHEGYYYPKLTSREDYHALTKPLPQMDRTARLLFVAAMTKGQTETNYAPRYVIFAKGDGAEKLIIVGLDDATLGTVYRARAVMAGLSSLARLSPMLKDADLEDQFTFYDLVRLLGFKEITISDGRAFAHRVALQ